MAAREGNEGFWHLPEEVSEDYLRQATSEHKIVERDRSGRPRESWVPVSMGMPNHYWDCEVMALAAADMMGIRLMRAKTPGAIAAHSTRERRQPEWVGLSEKGWWD